MSELAAPKRFDFLLLGGHPTIDFANTLLPPPGPDLEFLHSWSDVAPWLKAAGLSDGQNFEISKADASPALEIVRVLRLRWKTTLEEIIAGHGVSPQFVKQLNQFLALDTFSEALSVEGKRVFHLHRSKSALRGRDLALAIIARSIAEFLITADLQYLRHCANTDSCSIVFYDTTKNHRRQWCSNSMCGNRYKVAEFRRRQRAGRRKQRV